MVQQQAPSAVSPMGAQQPSMMQQMMATAGGVAIGSAVVSIFLLLLHL
jgi:tryptophan synthase alpha subunit